MIKLIYYKFAIASSIVRRLKVDEYFSEYVYVITKIRGCKFGRVLSSYRLENSKDSKVLKILRVWMILVF